MSTNVLVATEARAAVRADDYLGPASVASLDEGELSVELPDGTVLRAEPAFTVPYEPAPGDVLLVITKGPACYAIGVLHGAGKTVLALPGDVEIRAETGSLRLFGAKGVELLAPEVAVHAEKLRIVAGAVTQKFGSLVQRVRSLMTIHAGQSHTLIDDSHVTKSKSSTILTEDVMTINGKQIHLG